jgi:hypothetical protein
MDRRRLAAHEAGHAVAAHLLDRVIPMVSIDYAPTGGGVSVDRLPPEPLGHRRRPLGHWYEEESDCLTVLAGALSEDIDHDDVPAFPRTPQRVPEDPPRDPYPDLPEIPVAWQEADEPGWPEGSQSDEDQVRRLTAGIAGCEAERAALELALRYRALGMVESAHFKALHKALMDRLLVEGELYAAEIRFTLQRAELHYLLNAIPEDTDAPEAAT